ncbi:MAG: 4-hydroxybenzoate octaprenyltransferase [Rhodovarius sp.]|nr:4-hydroxybenzoate octaprenyltransferase [Rhodovarius sp.]MCX7931579.1 4-hydroxybenzoate octaprenyltransferase [Rhodovarius sp.]MDW8315665.1 4-hydroxybenzoate octaprenyltransferase [Rhodovarius sp.]
MQGWTDIRAEGWVARLPPALRPYALLMRLDRPIGSWLLFLPGLWAIALAAPDWGVGLWLTLLFAVGSVVMRGAGCVVNDLWDRDLDRRVERTRGRPIASGAVSPRQAILFLALLCSIGLLILLQLSPLAIALGVLSLLPVVLYPLAKRVTDYPQAVLGVTFGWGASLGYAAATGGWDGIAFLLHLAAFFWILGYDTIYAHQDRADDAIVGIRSTARRFEAATRPFLLACYGAMLLCLSILGWVAGLSALFFLALLVPAVLLARQVVTIDIHDPARCLALFKANREVGLAVAAALLVGRL